MQSAKEGTVVGQGSRPGAGGYRVLSATGHRTVSGQRLPQAAGGCIRQTVPAGLPAMGTSMGGWTIALSSSGRSFEPEDIIWSGESKFKKCADYGVFVLVFTLLLRTWVLI